MLKQLLPQNTKIVDSADATAKALEQVLIKQDLRTSGSTNQPPSYLVTDSAGRFQAVGEVFLGERLTAAHIELVDI